MQSDFSIRPLSLLFPVLQFFEEARKPSKVSHANVMTTVVLSYTTIFYLLHTGLFVAAHVVVVVSKQ